MIDFQRFELLTFDCYGTMIDWEAGIFSALRPILRGHGVTLPDSAILETYSELEASAEQGDFRSYRQVLASVVAGFGRRLGFEPAQSEIDSLANSLPRWEPFPDTVESLRRLKSRKKLAVISNVDDDLFAESAKKLGVAFDYVITAQQARCYKPNLNIFKMALERSSVPPEKILHVGQSIYHDVLPAQSLGIATAWVNRKSPRPNAGAAKRVNGVPELEVSDLKSLADRVLG